MINRYTTFFGMEVKDDTGEYVLFSDYNELDSENEALVEDNNFLKTQLIISQKLNSIYISIIVGAIIVVGLITI